MDIGSRTMHRLHVKTYSFTRVTCVPKEDTTVGQDLDVDHHIYVGAATTIPVEEPGSTLLSRESIVHLKWLCVGTVFITEQG